MINSLSAAEQPEEEAPSSPGEGHKEVTPPDTVVPFVDEDWLEKLLKQAFYKAIELKGWWACVEEDKLKLLTAEDCCEMAMCLIGEGDHFCVDPWCDFSISIKRLPFAVLCVS